MSDSTESLRAYLEDLPDKDRTALVQVVVIRKPDLKNPLSSTILKRLVEMCLGLHEDVVLDLFWEGENIEPERSEFDQVIKYDARLQRRCTPSLEFSTLTRWPKPTLFIVIEFDGTRELTAQLRETCSIRGEEGSRTIALVLSGDTGDMRVEEISVFQGGK